MNHMHPTSTEPVAPAGGRSLLEWRRRRLIVAGVDGALAAALARARGVDLHELLLLLDRGCPPELAARIVAPLDAPWP